MKAIRDVYKNFSLQIGQLLASSAHIPIKYELKELKDIISLTESYPKCEKFRWPTIKDLNDLKLNKPLRLKSIKTKGAA